MSLVLEILKELANTTLNYKGVRVNLFGIPQFKNYKRNSFQVTLNRLKNNNFIEKNNDRWVITKKGKTYLNQNHQILKNFESNFSEKSPKNLILIFDIPEKYKTKREWLRLHLKKFHFVMIQRSVWVGPAPLKKEFLDYLKEIDLKNKIQTFKLSKPYKIL